MSGEPPTGRAQRALRLRYRATSAKDPHRHENDKSQNQYDAIDEQEDPPSLIDCGSGCTKRHARGEENEGPAGQRTTKGLRANGLTFCAHGFIPLHRQHVKYPSDIPDMHGALPLSSRLQDKES